MGAVPTTHITVHIDAVLICTPLNLHAPMVIDALRAGKHVFIEKCLIFKEEEGERIRKVAEGHPQQVLQVGIQRRSSALYKVAMQMARKGAIGKVLLVRAQWHMNNDWRRPVSDAKYERLINWRMYREYSGGLMAELASHQIGVANWAIDAEPISVLATGDIVYWKDGRETCDNVEAIFEYPGGEKLLLSSALFNAHLEVAELIMGDQGTLAITLGKGLYFREKVAKVSSGAAKENWKAGATVIAASEGGIPIFPERISGSEPFLDRELKYAKRWLASLGISDYEEPHDPWYSEMVDFFASIREGKPVSASLDLGISEARAVIYANRAIDTGQKVFWGNQQA
jgi:predicted dehydrogenase